MIGTLIAKFWKVQDDQGYLILIVALNSIHLNPDYYLT